MQPSFECGRAAIERSATRAEQAAAEGTHATRAGMALPSTKEVAALTERVKLRSMNTKQELPTLQQRSSILPPAVVGGRRLALCAAAADEGRRTRDWSTTTVIDQFFSAGVSYCLCQRLRRFHQLSAPRSTVRHRRWGNIDREFRTRFRPTRQNITVTRFCYRDYRHLHPQLIHSRQPLRHQVIIACITSSRTCAAAGREVLQRRRGGRGGRCWLHWFKHSPGDTSCPSHCILLHARCSCQRSKLA